jgi:hypothetical protein
LCAQGQPLDRSVLCDTQPVLVRPEFIDGGQSKGAVKAWEEEEDARCESESWPGDCGGWAGTFGRSLARKVMTGGKKLGQGLFLACLVDSNI